MTDASNMWSRFIICLEITRFQKKFGKQLLPNLNGIDYLESLLLLGSGTVLKIPIELFGI